MISFALFAHIIQNIQGTDTRAAHIFYHMGVTYGGFHIGMAEIARDLMQVDTVEQRCVAKL